MPTKKSPGPPKNPGKKSAGAAKKTGEKPPENFRDKAADRPGPAPKIALVGGGTGGHTTPLFPVAAAIRARAPGAEFFFFGEPGGPLEKSRETLPGEFFPVPAGKLRRYFSLLNLLDFFKFARGFFVARKFLKKIRPDAIFSKGGFAAVPVVLAAAAAKIPVVVHESDASPGLATRITARFADKICVNFAAAGEFFPGQKIIETGLPVRAAGEFLDKKSGEKTPTGPGGISSSEPRSDERGGRFAREREATPDSGEEICAAEIFVTGGSQGSRDLNRFLWKIFPEILARGVKISHQTGAPSLPEAKKFAKNLPEKSRENYFFAASLAPAEMAKNFAGAKIVAARAGATTLAEIAETARARGETSPPPLAPEGRGEGGKSPAKIPPTQTASGDLDSPTRGELGFGGPAMILFPLPRSKSRGDQILNAEIWENAGAARVFDEEKSDPAAARDAVLEFLENSAAREKCARAAAKFARPDAAERVAAAVLAAAGR